MCVVFLLVFCKVLKVACNMNIYISEETRRKNPNFSKLIEQVEKKCFGNTLIEEESKLWLAKSDWLNEEIIFTVVQDILNEKESQYLNHGLDKQHKKIWEAVIKCFVVCQCSACFSSNKPILGLDQSKLEHLLDDYKENLEEGKRLLAAEVETRLESICLRLTDMHDGKSSTENPKIQHARAVQIGDILKQDKLDMHNCEKQLKELLIKEMNVRVQYHQELQMCADVLLKLVTKYCHRLQPHKDQTLAKNAIVSCQTLASKLKSIRMELKCETYTPAHLEALRKLRAEIIETSKRRELESADIEHQLEMYRRLGAEFEAIATEYGNAKNDIEKQGWTLSEIKHKLSTN